MLNEVSFVVFRFFVEYICNHDDGACERMTDLSKWLMTLQEVTISL